MADDRWDKVLDAAAEFGEHALKRKPPPDITAKVGHLVLNPDSDAIKEQLKRDVDEVLDRAVHGALHGAVRGVARPVRSRGLALAVWGAGFGFFLANLLPLLHTISIPDMMQLAFVIFAPTALLAFLVGQFKF